MSNKFNNNHPNQKNNKWNRNQQNYQPNQFYENMQPSYQYNTYPNYNQWYGYGPYTNSYHYPHTYTHTYPHPYAYQPIQYPTKYSYDNKNPNKNKRFEKKNLEHENKNELEKEVEKNKSFKIKSISDINNSFKTLQNKDIDTKNTNNKEPKRILIKIKNANKLSDEEIMKEIDRQITEEIAKHEADSNSNFNKKPLIIKNNTVLSDIFATMKSDNKKDKDNDFAKNVIYLEDSDDENDMEIESYKEIIVKKDSGTKINFIPLKKIIGKDEIKSIDDLITVSNYYEKIYKNKNVKKSEEPEEIDNESDDTDEEKDVISEEKNVISEEKDIETNEKELEELDINFDDNFSSSDKKISNPVILSKKLEKIHKMLRYIFKIEKLIREDIESIDIKSKYIIMNNVTRIKDYIKNQSVNDMSNYYLTLINGIIEDIEPLYNSNYKNLYKLNDNYYNINLEKVYKLKGPLIKLKKMVGLNNIKDQIIDMILYYLMEFEKSNNNMLHMSIEGSPGCGKTKLAKILSKILCSLDILESDKVVYARRSDLIGQYVGHTGQKTQKMIDNALGGVLFIDEAYSLGTGNDKKDSGSDSFSKECMDVLNQNLSDNKKKFICVIAGYSDELDKCFFSTNPGLPRRFPFRFKISPYSGNELCKIFINKINKLEWKLSEDVEDLNKFFNKNKEVFKYFGGDIEIFIQDIKYTHSRRVICMEPSDYKIINNNDINKSFEKFKKRRTNEEITNNFISTLYV